MLQPRYLALGASTASASTSASSLLSPAPTTSLLSHLTHLTFTPPIQIQTQIQKRHASHATQGRANKAAGGPGKRLGAKRAASELVVPGCILFRQRGAKWWPGENAVMGRDHTISALAKGYVRYYRDPEVHPKRKLIGVVFEQHERLPRGRNMSRRRRLGLRPTERVVEGEKDGDGVEDGVETEKWKTQFKDGYQYRPSNTEIGRAAKESGRKYPVYKPGDRWLAWRLRNERRQAALERAELRKRTSAKKGKGKGKKGKAVARV